MRRLLGWRGQEGPHSSLLPPRSSWISSAASLGLVAVLLTMVGVTLWEEMATQRATNNAAAATRRSDLAQKVLYGIAWESSLQREYWAEADLSILSEFTDATQAETAAIQALSLSGALENVAEAQGISTLQKRYVMASRQLFVAVQRGDEDRASVVDAMQIQPLIATMVRTGQSASRVQEQEERAALDALQQAESTARAVTALVVTCGLALLALLWFIQRAYRSRSVAQLQASEERYRTLSRQLEQRVVERTAQLEDAISNLHGEISERKRAEEAARVAGDEAEAANAAKSEFLSRMSHELRTPLHAILGFAQLLESSPLLPDDSESVAHILKGGQHLLALINEVLDITRVEAGAMSLSLEPVAVDEIVYECLDLVGSLAAQQNVQLRTDISRSGDVYVLADTQRLKQVLLNLVSNAVKYNREGGTVTLTCVPGAPHKTRLQVADTGPGITPSDIARLFTPFQRLNADERGIEGTGLGLVLSQHLVQAMDGTLGVESTVGEGSTFWIELPLTSAPPEHDDVLTETDHDAISSPSSASHTILYIEDNLSNLALVEAMLSYRPEMKLLVAMQGGLGLDLAREHCPDLILLDLHLPDMRGNDVLNRLQEDEQTRHIPVVMLSADAIPRQVDALLAAGARAYLTKPLGLQPFLTALDAHLAKEADTHG